MSNVTQLPLTAHVGPRPGTTIEQNFREFHAANPSVYRELVALARAGKARGADRLGMKALFEVVRWNRFMATSDWSGFRLNNNYTALYARLIMDREPDLAGVFATRQLHVVEESA